MTVRLERVREMLKRTLGEIIRRDYPPGGDNGLITVSDVTVTPDLKEADVYIGVVGKAEAKKRAMNQLNGNRGQIQFELGRSIILRFTPKIQFHLDESVERGNRILSILDELEKQEPPKP
jgi:ribosome-binding factor A